MHEFDLIIKNGTLVDPEKRRITVGHLGISGGKIAAITREDIRGRHEIDAGLAIVCPGFIDIHAHVDGYLYAAQCMVRQGVTTSVGGNCGFGPLDLQSFFDGLERDGFPLNQAMLIGHSFTLREKAGAVDPYAPATPEQVDCMLSLLEEAFDQGAIGLSFGLEYAPGTSFDEVLALSQVAARYGKLIAVHTRTDSWPGLGALKEAVRITEFTGAPVQVSHLVYQVGMGMMIQALEILDRAVRDGLDVAADSGMYHAFATFIGSPVYDEGCLEKWGCDYGDLFVATGKYAGQRCTREIYQELRANYKNDVVVAFACREAEVYQALLPGYVMVSTDGAVGSPQPGTGHPQDSGTYPRFFQKMVREQGSLSLVEAVRRCTLLPAERLGLLNKGRLKIGADADIVIFNLDRITDRADYPGIGRPDAPPEGINYVLVNGEVVVENGRLLEHAKPGRPVRAVRRYWRWQ
ncbi:amidohydrolase family protein [Desulfofundulus thermobenzoicus]|uniref:Amidohydrolase family protein n=1 Tax=Desulfofundulus thermobenzoicus TaxID=29376 RepID=A0A6N7IL75_9FIRM|nr:amidohydrolase family protein [Desulfofundulus thermobenzoicus]MQL50732.1 amidohydrolase family protein [Desulfofundulus thermobenzoicus]